MKKTFVNDVAGKVTPVDQAALQAGFQPDPTARRDFIRPPLAGGQPGENINGADGAMVTRSPSDSGQGAMIAGDGTRGL